MPRSQPTGVDAHRERAGLLRERWRTLPDSAKVPNQLAGRGAVACGATYGLMERCDLACTSCYLTAFANHTDPLPVAEGKRQLDELRAGLGEGGKIQLTSGEVTLLPVEHLGELVAYARGIGLEPMVMSNGERIRHEPDYLDKLVGDFGLRRISIHIDTTQRGRTGEWAHVRSRVERDLHPLRAAYCEQLRETKRKTGAPLRAASTVTVTPDNVEGVADSVDFHLDHADAIRMLSFQPSAPVGRTRSRDADRAPKGGDPLEHDALWERICRPIGRKIHSRAMQFGHPECNVTVPMVVVRDPGRPGSSGRYVVEVSRAGRPFENDLLGILFAAFSVDDDDRSERPPMDSRRWWRVPLAALAALGRRPLLAARCAAWLARRTLGEWRAWRMVLGTLLRGRIPTIRPFVIVVHRFMGPEELETPLGKERLEACVFRVPIDGRLVSMCELNATDLRARLDRELVDSRGERERSQAATG